MKFEYVIDKQRYYLMLGHLIYNYSSENDLIFINHIIKNCEFDYKIDDLFAGKWKGPYGCSSIFDIGFAIYYQCGQNIINDNVNQEICNKVISYANYHNINFYKLCIKLDEKIKYLIDNVTEIQLEKILEKIT
jgi:hypothetical protein